MEFVVLSVNFYLPDNEFLFLYELDVSSVPPLDVTYALKIYWVMPNFSYGLAFITSLNEDVSPSPTFSLSLPIPESQGSAFRLLAMSP